MGLREIWIRGGAAARAATAPRLGPYRFRGTRRTERCVLSVHAADSGSPAAEVWSLLARPDRWHEWSPYVRGTEGLGEPEVREGARGRVRLLGAPIVPATITRVRPGHSWSWRVGPVELDHRVLPTPGGSRIEIHLGLTGALPDLAATLAYGPICSLMARRIARVAERSR